MKDCSATAQSLSEATWSLLCTSLPVPSSSLTITTFFFFISIPSQQTALPILPTQAPTSKSLPLSPSPLRRESGPPSPPDGIPSAQVRILGEGQSRGKSRVAQTWELGLKADLLGVGRETARLFSVTLAESCLLCGPLGLARP